MLDRKLDDSKLREEFSKRREEEQSKKGPLLNAESIVIIHLYLIPGIHFMSKNSGQCDKYIKLFLSLMKLNLESSILLFCPERWLSFLCPVQCTVFFQTCAKNGEANVQSECFSLTSMKCILYPPKLHPRVRFANLMQFISISRCHSWF